MIRTSRLARLHFASIYLQAFLKLRNGRLDFIALAISLGKLNAPFQIGWNMGDVKVQIIKGQLQVAAVGVAHFRQGLEELPHDALGIQRQNLFSDFAPSSKRC